MHSCPECYSACYCGGDIDDIDLGEDSPEADACTHCPIDGYDDDRESDETDTLTNTTTKTMEANQ